MNCKLNRNILRTTSCGYQLLEIKEIYLGNFDDISTSITSDTAGCESITAVTSAATATGTVNVYKIQPTRNSVSFTDELVVDDNSGAKYRTHTLTFGIPNKYDACLHIDFDNLSLGKFIAFVVTADGNMLALGRLVGLEASAATFGGGSDQNGITVTLAANVAESAMPVSDTAKEQVEGLVAA